MTLTDVQEKALRIIRERPGLSGLSVMAKLGKGTSYDVLHNLEDQGLIVWREVGWYTK